MNGALVREFLVRGNIYYIHYKRSAYHGRHGKYIKPAAANDKLAIMKLKDTDRTVPIPKDRLFKRRDR